MRGPWRPSRPATHLAHTETAHYGIVRDNLETFLSRPRGTYGAVATIADVREARRILERLGVPSDAPEAARAREPTYLDDEQQASPSP